MFLQQNPVGSTVELSPILKEFARVKRGLILTPPIVQVPPSKLYSSCTNSAA